MGKYIVLFEISYFAFLTPPSGGDCGNQDYIMVMVRLTIVVVEVMMMMVMMVMVMMMMTRRRMMTRMVMIIIRNLVIQVVVPTGVELGKRLIHLKNIFEYPRHLWLRGGCHIITMLTCCQPAPWRGSCRSSGTRPCSLSHCRPCPCS